MDRADREYRQLEWSSGPRGRLGAKQLAVNERRRIQKFQQRRGEKLIASRRDSQDEVVWQ